MKEKKKFKLSVWQVLSLGFLSVIILGSLVLLLPFATREGESTTYINSLFTATSALCVTGLVPYDTYTHWTLFGQFVILFLIQLGGLGFMTFVSAVMIMFRRNMGIYGRNILMHDSYSNSYTALNKMVKRILLGTLIFEGFGACLLMIRFIPDFGILKGTYFSIWHSISAFCNAGFDLMGSKGNEFVSLARYAKDPLVILTISLLILIGGIGFCVWNDFMDSRANVKKMQLHTKVVLLVNTIAMIVGVLLYLLFEYDSKAMEGYSFGELILSAVFLCSTTRTAGFTTFDLATLSHSGYLVMLIFMFIGGNSGSTAGGIKMTTMTVIIVGMLAVFRGRKDINIGKKRLDDSLLSQALAILASCLMILMISTVMICAVEKEVAFDRVLFECVSALSTAGLSLSLTPSLSWFSKIILIILMFAGRVGILTLALALGEKRTAEELRKPIDNLYIG